MNLFLAYTALFAAAVGADSPLRGGDSAAAAAADVDALVLKLQAEDPALLESALQRMGFDERRLAKDNCPEADYINQLVCHNVCYEQLSISINSEGMTESVYRMSCYIDHAEIPGGGMRYSLADCGHFCSVAYDHGFLDCADVQKTVCQYVCYAEDATPQTQCQLDLKQPHAFSQSQYNCEAFCAAEKQMEEQMEEKLKELGAPTPHTDSSPMPDRVCGGLR